MNTIPRTLRLRQVAHEESTMPTCGAEFLGKREWAQRLRNRDPEAFREFLRSESGRMYSLVYRMIPRRDDIEDVVQEIFIEVWKSLPTFRGDASLRTWMHRIAVNTCVRHHRRQRPADTAIDDDAEMEEESSTVNIEESMLQADLQHRVQAALDSLPERLRQVIVLHEIEGFTHREMAQMLGVPVGTAKSRLFHALSKLRDRLEPYVLAMEAPVTHEEVL